MTPAQVLQPVGNTFEEFLEPRMNLVWFCTNCGVGTSIRSVDIWLRTVHPGALPGALEMVLAPLRLLRRAVLGYSASISCTGRRLFRNDVAIASTVVLAPRYRPHASCANAISRAPPVPGHRH